MKRGVTPIAAEANAKDPDNKLLWHYSRRRLAAEEIRDAMLAVSGRLNLKASGPSVLVPVDAELPGEVLEQGRAGMMRAQERILAPLASPFRPAFLAVLTQLIDGNSQSVPSESGFDVERRPRKKPPTRGDAED